MRVQQCSEVKAKCLIDSEILASSSHEKLKHKYTEKYGSYNKTVSGISERRKMEALKSSYIAGQECCVTFEGWSRRNVFAALPPGKICHF